MSKILGSGAPYGDAGQAICIHREQYHIVYSNHHLRRAVDNVNILVTFRHIKCERDTDVRVITEQSRGVTISESLKS